MVLTNIEMAEMERASQKSTISFLVAEVTTVSDMFEADYYLTKVKAVENEVLVTHRNILACGPLNMAIHQQEHEAMLKEVAKVICSLMRKKAGFSSHTTALTSGTDVASILLPHFNGVSAEWMEFKERYTSKIHNNAILEDAEKLLHLKRCFVGEAANFLKTILLKCTHYDEVWKQVVGRFENKRELVFIELRKLTRQPQIHPDSADGMWGLFSVSQDCIRALETLGEPVFQWDTILAFLILEKLDVTSRQCVELTLRNMEMPKVNEVLSFLEKRAKALTLTKSYSAKKPRLMERSDMRPLGQYTRDTSYSTPSDLTRLNPSATNIENIYLRQRIELLQKQTMEFENLHKLRDTPAEVSNEVQEVNVTGTHSHSSVKQTSRNHSLKRWVSYTFEEDEKIVGYLKNQGVRDVGIKSGTWEAMKSAIFSRSPHTVYSLENRYRKTIVPKLESYFSTSTECDVFKCRIASNLKRKMSPSISGVTNPANIQSGTNTDVEDDPAPS